MNKRVKFPALAVILLLFGIVWLLNELGVISIDVPWIPTIIIVIATAMIVNRYAN